MPNQYTKHPLTIDQKLFSKIEKEKAGHCWLWKGTILNGHGVIQLDGKTTYAERLMYELHIGGKIPKGKIVCHTCGNTRCLNPDHFTLSTREELILVSKAKHRPRIKEETTMSATRARSFPSAEGRILSKVRKKGICWLWTGAVINGHGVMKVSNRVKYVERVMYELHSGRPIQKRKLVLHSCSNRLCLNPSHLYLGTPFERNIINLEIRRNVKLDLEAARRMREERLEHHVKIRELAERYHVHPNTASRVVRKINWKEIMS